MAYTDIDNPADHFNTVLYTGNGVNSTDSQSITGVGFQPNWVWIKNRNTTNWHILSDSVRGGNKVLYTNRTDAERSDVDWYLQTFDSDGFTVGYSGDTNGNGNSLVSWNWLAGGSASSNSNGSITSSVSANTTAGFSIVSFTGTGSNATVGHGLGVAPKMIITKKRSSADNWFTYHASIAATKVVYLDLTTAAETYSTNWNDTEPTSSVFSLGTAGTNSNNQTYIAYCFAEKKGYSKFGSYKGNSNADGTFVYTGFRPAFILTKATTTGQSWQLYDNKRNTLNQSNKVLFFFHNYAEQDDTSAAAIDILSNGFKQRVNDAGGNSSSHTYLYWAIADTPFVNSNGVPGNAR